MYPATEERLNQDIAHAKVELAKWRAIYELIKDNTLVCEIEISGIRVGTCNNLKLKNCVNYNIKEINKFLRGEPNEYE